MCGRQVDKKEMAFHMGKRPVVSCFSPSCALLCRCLCMCAWPFLASALATIRRPLRVESPCVWLPFEAREVPHNLEV